VARASVPRPTPSRQPAFVRWVTIAADSASCRGVMNRSRVRLQPGSGYDDYGELLRYSDRPHESRIHRRWVDRAMVRERTR
jgi:hypothetical protein